MMQMSKKGKMMIAAAAAAAMLFGTGARALAASREIVVSDGSRITVDGVMLIPRDKNGNQVENIQYNGTTYTPVGTLAEASGFIVDYTASGQIKLTTPAPSAQDGYIGEEAARQRALTHAGVNEYSATFISVTKEWKNNIMLYRVEFLVGDTEYDYTVNAVTGAITGYDYDIDWYQTENSKNEDYLGIGKAKEIALKDAGLSGKKVTYVKNKLDWDDGRAQYEIEFVYGNKEYDYEIDALTGKILDKDFDIDDYYNYESSNVIGLDAAKEIARKDAGLSASGITYHKAKLDRDHGSMIYEIEFYSGSTEYEYEIDAITGKILERDHEGSHYSASGLSLLSLGSDQTSSAVTAAGADTQKASAAAQTAAAGTQTSAAGTQAAAAPAAAYGTHHAEHDGHNNHNTHHTSENHGSGTHHGNGLHGHSEYGCWDENCTLDHSGAYCHN